MRVKSVVKITIVIAVATALGLFVFFGFGKSLTLDNLKNSRVLLENYWHEQPVVFAAIYVASYIAMAALAIPGATVLTLAGGAIFGFWLGLILVSVASTLGATLALLGSRFLFRDFVQSRFPERLEQINEGIRKEGAYYLFMLRLVPLFPFFIVNLVMGLTPIRPLTFLFVSQIGMLPGTAAYVNAGVQLASIHGMSGIISPKLLLSFALLGVLPIVAKRILEWYNGHRHLRKFKKPRRFDYNMVVIGGGSAGLVSAYIAAAVRAKVALIEKHKMGGDCLNTGCVPSKAFIRSAKLLHDFKHAGEFGIEALPTKVNFAKVMDRVQQVIHQIEPHDSVERYTKLGVECIQGAAKIRTPYEVEVGGRVLTTRNIVVATGASPAVPPIPGLTDHLTSDTVWNLRELPQKLVILGGGPIGCELAQSFARFGSQVTIVEASDRLLQREDPDVSEFVSKKFQSEGVRIATEHKALRVENGHLVCEYRGSQSKYEYDKILIAVGRKANTKGFGLEELDVELNPNGTITADPFLRTTNYPNIYVCGDVTGPFQFTHASSHQAWYAAVNSLFSPFKRYKADYRVLPWCTFTDPEVARVGVNEQEAKAKRLEYQINHYDIGEVDRAITEGEAHGFIKVLTAKGSDKVLGVTIVGAHAGEIIGEYVSAMKHGFGMNKILSTIHIYPTLAEANKYAAGAWKKANAPESALQWLKRFHSWRRG